MARRRNVHTDALLFSDSSNDERGWRVTRTIKRDVAERQVADGLMSRVHDTAGNVVGYQLAEGPNTSDRPARSGASSLSIAARESKANAGLDGSSRTKHLSEEQRINRVHPKSGKLLEPEDAVERAEVKVKIWPELSGA